MDARTRYTQRVIRDAFMHLLVERSVEKVTVSDICRIAEINRATFYRHYANQYELLETIEEEKLAKIREAAVHEDDIDAAILCVVRTLYAEQEEWRLLLGDHGDSRFSSRISALFADRFKPQMKSEESILRYRFLSHGLTGLLDDWMRSGMQLSPEAMALYAGRFRRALVAGRGRHAD